MKGGGLERYKDNEARGEINSTRMEVEEILTWRKRKIDSWAKRRQGDIEQGKKKQKEDREEMNRFRKKWNLSQPN